MFEAGKEYVTRNGLRARVYATDAGGQWPIHGAVMVDGSFLWIPHVWSESGHFQENSGLDIIPPVMKRNVWVNVYPSSQGFTQYEREITFTPGEGL